MRIPNVKCVSALRLPNGSTLVSNGACIDEYDCTGALAWRFDCVVDGKLKPALITGMTRLKNGNTIFAYYHNDPKLPDIIEVSADKKIVSSHIYPTINLVVAVQLLDETMKPCADELVR
jgi:hypothetical protein